ncbi:MAG: ABC transporter permease [Sphaerochaetaceae bacterium]|nr:ABC transporter permease [Sphaerochaetaceae bacterium]
MDKKKKGKIISIFLIAIITLFISWILILLVGTSFTKACSGFYKGILGSSYNISEVLVKMSPLLLCSIGISVAFQTNFINIGADGQLYIGAIIATIVAMYFNLPTILVLIIALILGFIFGGMYSLIPGILKSKFGISEVINTIMLNYISIGITGILVKTILMDKSGFFPMSPEIEASFPIIIGKTRLHLGIIISIVLALVVQFWLDRTKSGFYIRAIGQNVRASRCAGIKINKNILISAMLSGGFAALAGVFEILGVQHRLMVGISSDFGYTAIIVALLANNKPKNCILTSLGIAALQVGSLSMQRYAGVPSSIALLIMGVIVLLHLGNEALFPFLYKESK